MYINYNYIHTYKHTYVYNVDNIVFIYQNLQQTIFRYFETYFLINNMNEVYARILKFNKYY